MQLQFCRVAECKVIVFCLVDTICLITRGNYVILFAISFYRFLLKPVILNMTALRLRISCWQNLIATIVNNKTFGFKYKLVDTDSN